MTEQQFLASPWERTDMPFYATTVHLPRPLEEIFTYFSRPGNLLQLIPPDLHLELLEGPEVLQQGSRLVWKGRRWGIAQRIIQEVTQFEANQLMVEEQRQGPFARWVHARHFETSHNGTQLREEIQYEPPGGLLGRMVSADAIRKDLDKLYLYRAGKLKEIFG